MTDCDNSYPWTRLGLIAGSGDLPVELAHAVEESNPYIVRVRGFADAKLEAFDGKDFSVGQIGGIIKALKAAHCDKVCFAGYITRPDLKNLQMDARGLIFVPKALAAGRNGDDAVVRVIIEEFESAGFEILGPDEVMSSLTPTQGVLGAIKPTPNQQDDIDKAVHIARRIGELDIGQGVVVSAGMVLAVEAQEGTSAMLERVSALPGHLDMGTDERNGVLAKMPKPIQELRIDLPTIGIETVRLGIKAGLSGIVLEAGGALILERAEVIAELDKNGMFLVAVPAESK